MHALLSQNTKEIKKSIVMERHELLICQCCQEELHVTSFSRSQQKRLKQGRSCWCSTCVTGRLNKEQIKSHKTRPVPFSGKPGTTLSEKRRAWINTFVASDWSYGPRQRTHGWPKKKRKPYNPTFECCKCHVIKSHSCFSRKAWKNRNRGGALCHACDQHWSKRPRRLKPQCSRPKSGKIPSYIEFQVDFSLT